MMEALKKAHEGKRVNDGNSFDPDRYNYIAWDESNLGFSRQDLKIRHQQKPKVVFVDSEPVPAPGWSIKKNGTN